jgi:hypothetical protein
MHDDVPGRSSKVKIGRRGNLLNDSRKSRDRGGSSRSMMAGQRSAHLYSGSVQWPLPLVGFALSTEWKMRTWTVEGIVVWKMIMRSARRSAAATEVA